MDGLITLITMFMCITTCSILRMRNRFSHVLDCDLSMSSTSVALRSLRDSVWLDQARYEQAECRYQQALACRHTESTTSSEVGKRPNLTFLSACVCGSISQGRAISTGYGLSDSIEATMSIIQQSLSATTQVCIQCTSIATNLLYRRLCVQTNRRADQEQRISALEKENQQLKKGPKYSTTDVHCCKCLWYRSGWTV